MTDTIEPAVSTGSGGSARGGAISAMRMPELQALAAQLGVTGTSRMRKSDLVDAIEAKNGGSKNGGAKSSTRAAAPSADAPAAEAPATRTRRAATRAAGRPETAEP
ncbi:Rho termination factor N-terminal domain-containing protein, partial [Cellulomonas triticagri]|uniref:Rho termination factor N-terminal domain-containing protein n=1 Tax=Cellulomonas triticagri TaxID=2483352 RepID=UPI001F3A56F9